MSEGLGLFRGKEQPDRETAWSLYQEALDFNQSVNLDETVKVNENFYIGKQWEGVQANGLPTPQFNVLKRVTGFVVASMTSEALRITASPLAAYPKDDTFIEPVRILNEEFESLAERNRLPQLARELARDAAVRGDGCIFTWWDPDAETGQKAKGAIRSEMVENTRVFFGNPNERRVQEQPWIMIAKRETIRSAKKRAKENGEADWEQISCDDEGTSYTDTVKNTYDKVTTVLLLWKDDDKGEVHGYEFCHNAQIRKPWKLGIRLYPIVWLNWDYVADCYHGQAMITGLIPNQVFINKAWAMSMLSMMRSAWPKTVYDRTRIAHWDNRVGGAIGVAGNVEGVAKILDPAQVSPQVFQFISAAVSQTEESLGATSAALGEGKAYNTSAILSLQKAASTPTELTKQNLYGQMEDLARIYLEFMAANYGKRDVDMPTPDNVRAIVEQANQLAQEVGQPEQEIPQEITTEFDFSQLKNHPMSIRIDVGASSYYSEIASLQTLDNLLLNNRITTVQYLERIPDGNVAGRRKLIEELKEEEERQRQAEQAAAEEQKQQAAMQQAQQMMEQNDAMRAEQAEAEQADMARAERRSQQLQRHGTGFRELGEALRSLGR